MSRNISHVCHNILFKHLRLKYMFNDTCLEIDIFIPPKKNIDHGRAKTVCSFIPEMWGGTFGDDQKSMLFKYQKDDSPLCAACSSYTISQPTYHMTI
jgi:hypothetical protein